MRSMMQQGPLAIALAVAAGLGLATTQAAAQEQEQPQQEKEETTCKAVLAPAAIVQQEQPIAMQVSFAEEIGTTTEVTAREESGLEVIKVEKAEEIEKAAKAEGEETEEGEAAEYESAVEIPAYDVLLRLNAAEAVDGQWELRFVGTEGECVGQVQVTLPAEEGDVPPAEEGSGEQPPRA